MTKRINRSRSFYPRAFQPRQHRSLRLGGGLGPDLRPRAISLRSALATTALATGVLLGATTWAPQQAEALCIVADDFFDPNVVNCGGLFNSQTTVDNTVIGPTDSLRIISRDDRHYQFNDADDTIVTIADGAEIDGFGLAVENTVAGAAIIADHEGEISIDAGNTPTVGGAGVFNLITFGGNVTYTGNGSVIDNDGSNEGLVIDTGAGAGNIMIGTAGIGVVPTYQGTIALHTISGTGNQAVFLDGGTITTVGDPFFGGAIRMNSSSGNLNLTLEGGTQLINGNGVATGEFGINTISNSGDITIVSDADIGTAAARFDTGINAFGTSGQIDITQSGNIFTSNRGIFVNATAVGGNPVNVTNDGDINSTGAGIIVNADGTRNVTVTNTIDGHIEATGGPGVRIAGGNIATVNNDFSSNSIIGNPNGVEIVGAAEANVNNTFGGSITGITGNGVFIDTIAGDANVNNSNGGNIFGGVGGAGGLNGILLTTVGGTTTINNSLGGGILGTNDGIQGTTLGPVVINNSLGGSIIGNTGEGIDLNTVGPVTINNSLGGVIQAQDGNGLLVNTVVGNVELDNSFGGSIVGLDTTGGFRSGALILGVTGDVVVDNRGGTIFGQTDAGLAPQNITGNVAIDNSQGGTIFGGLTGIPSFGVTGNVTIDNSNGGTITGDNLHGIDLFNIGGDVGIDNSDDGTITGLFDGIQINTAGNVAIDNRGGDITGTQSAGVEMTAINGSVDILTGSTIRGGTFGVTIVQNAGAVGDVNITNLADGLIVGETAAGVFVNAAAANNVTIDNDGTIQGNSLGTGLAGSGIHVVSGNLVTIINSSKNTIIGDPHGIQIDGVAAVAINNDDGGIQGLNGDGININNIGGGAGPVGISNVNGEIEGTDDGIEIANAGAVSIDNRLGQITGTGGEGILLAGIGAGGVEILNNDGAIEGTTHGLQINTVGDVNIVNGAGSITGTGASADGLRILSAANATITVGPDGSIIGGDDGIVIYQVTGLVDITNAGTIQGQGNAAAPNDGEGILIAVGGTPGTEIDGAVRIVNSGDILGNPAAPDDVGGQGINVAAAGGIDITNQSDATISGGGGGIAAFSTGTDDINVTNRAGGTIEGFFGAGVFAQAGAEVDVTVDNAGRIIGNSDGSGSGSGVHVVGGNLVTIINSSKNTIIGNPHGIEIAGAAQVVINNDNGGITGLNGDGINIVNIGGGAGTVDISSVNGEIEGTDDGIEIATAGDVTIDNRLGNIVGAGSDGINLQDVAAVDISNNDGTIDGQGDDGINIFTAGTVDISNVNGEIMGDDDGIAVDTAGNVTIDNRLGDITGGDDGIELDAVGAVAINNRDGTITGGDNAIDISVATAVTITNDGGTIDGQGDDGIDIFNVGGGAGTVDISNVNGEIMGADDGIAVNIAGDVTIDNQLGDITGGDDGIQLNTVGAVAIDNRVGTITGGDNGIDINGAGAVDIDNRLGDITGGDDGIDINGVASVDINNRDGTITGINDDGIEIDNVTTDVTIDNSNGGTITGDDDGINIDTNVGGSVLVDNRNGGTITGGDEGVEIDDVVGDVTIDNRFAGTITGDTGDGIEIDDVGGSLLIDNSFFGTITSNTQDGIDVDGRVAGDVTILNRFSGIITGSSDGIEIDDVGGNVLIDNREFGTITGGNDGLDIGGVDGNVVVDNRGFGTITGGNDGIEIDGVGGTVLVDNRNGGSIEGQNDDGIDVDGALGVTVLNQGDLGLAGTILGGDDGIVLANVGASGVVINNSLEGSIIGTNGDGIQVSSSPTATVFINNTSGGLIHGQGGDGINIDDVFGVTIWNQAASDGGIIIGAFNGVSMSNVGAGGVDIDNRHGIIRGEDGHGIEITDSGLAPVMIDNRNDGLIEGLDNTGLGGDGIHVSEATAGSGGAFGVVILNNADGGDPGGTIFGHQSGIHLADIGAGGVFIANEGGTITGDTGDGVHVDGSVGAVDVDNEDGTIIGGNSGVVVMNVADDVTIDNDGGTIIGQGDEGIAVASVVGNVGISNQNGTITGFWDGIDIENIVGSVVVDNTLGGSITGTNADGVDISIVSGDVTIDNDGGTITGGGDEGIAMNAIGGNVGISNQDGIILGSWDGIDIDGVGGSVVVDNTLGSITGTNADGVDISNVGVDVTIDNDEGTITGGGDEGVAVANVGGNVGISNQDGIIVGFWDGIDINGVGGTVLVDNRNDGSITGQGGDGIDVDGAFGVTVLNQGNGDPAGTILGNDDGIVLANIGTGNVLVDNRFGGSITGTFGNGVKVENSPNATVLVDNRGDGTIFGGDDGIDVNTALEVTILNQGDLIGGPGTITGGEDGVDLENIGTGGVLINNSLGGTITGINDDGIEITTVASDVTILNHDGGFISGDDDGIDIEDVTGDVLVDNSDFGHIEGFSNEGIEIDDVVGNVDIDNSSGGLIRGEDDGIDTDDVSGNVVVDNSSGGVITGVTGDGIDIDDTGGNVTVNNDGGETTGADSGVEINGVGGNVEVSNLLDGVIIGGEEGVEIRNVAGNATIDNDGLIQGQGSLGEPVIEVVNVTGEVDIFNQANGVIRSDDPLVSLADSRFDLAIMRDFDDFFGGVNGLPDMSVDAALALLPDYIDAANDVAMVVDSDGGNTITNDGLLVGQGRFNTDGDGTLVVNNGGGVWLTSGLNTFTGSTDDVVENHGLVQTAFDASADEVTIFDQLDRFENHGVLSMMDGAEGDRTEISGTFAAGSGWLAVDTFFGPPGVGESDVLAIGGDMDGSTAVVINKTNAFPGGLNDVGITVVEIGGDTENDCFGVLCQVGDAGFISEQSEDFFAFGGHNFVHDNGLFLWGMTQRDGDDPIESELVLVSDIGPHGAQLPTLITAAQNVWYESTSVVEDHIYGLRYGVAPGFAPLADMPVDDGLYRKGPVAPPMAEQPARSAAWFKVYGSRTDQDTSVRRNFDGTATKLEFDTGYEQDTLGLMGGADFGNKIAPDVMFRFGVFGGYTDSDVDFDSLGSAAELKGPLVGGYLSYSSGGFYVDAMGRADFLKMDLALPTLPGDFDGVDDSKVTSIGVLANVGYRHEMGSAFIEPIGSFAYVNSDMDSFKVSDAKVSFSDDESLRVGGGGRIGGTLHSGPTHAVEASILGKVWHEFEDNTVTITDAFDASTTVSDDAKGTFGEVTGSLTAYDLDRSWSVFVSGGAKFNKDFVTYGGKGGVRYSF